MGVDALYFGLIIAAGGVIFSGLLAWVAYVSKNLNEHSKWMAVTAEKLTAVQETVSVHEQMLRPIPPTPFSRAANRG